jgi:hypothetical protein
MATTTPNFGWAVPTSTDLVKDGAVAIETLGDAIDASLLDLKGGTTGQVLSKATNTDMDFTWVAQDDSNAIQNAIVDAKGDIIAATANDTPARLAVGTNGQVLTADSTAATGLKWATAAGGGGKVLQVIMATTSTEVANSTSTLVDSGITATITPSSASSKVLVLVTMAVGKTAGNTGNHLIAALLRGATNVISYDAGHLYTGSALILVAERSFNYLDTPATTSATTYKVQFSNSSNNAAIKAQFDSASTSTIILMEIGA